MKAAILFLKARLAKLELEQAAHEKCKRNEEAQRCGRDANDIREALAILSVYQ